MKKIICIILALVFILILTACNHQVIDTTWNFNYAIIKLPNGDIVEGKCDSWKDYDNSDQLQIKIDGVQYLVHACNAVLEHR